MAIEANIIKIKRSGTSGAPASLKLGELAYSYLTASGNPTSNGGDRLFIGANGVNGGTGNANDVIVIGGKYFTDLLDHERGILTASSALVVDASKKLDELLVDNLSLNGNTLSTTDTNGNLTLSPNGTGLVSIAGAFTLPRVDGTAGYVLTTNGAGVVSWQASAAVLNIAGTTGTDGISLLSETLTFAGATTPVSVAVTANTVTVAVADATTSAKGLASFDTTDFTVTSGAVTVKEERIQDIVGAMVSSNSESNIGVTYDDTNGKLDFSVATATSSTLGVASFNSTDFTVTSGAVTVNAERVEDIVGAMVSTNTESGISVTYDDTNGKLDFNVNDPVITIAGDVDGFATMTNLGDTTITVTLDTVNTNVGTFGSTTSIPVITVNGKGLITGVTTQSISTTLNIAGTTGTDAVALGSDTLTFAGSGAISTAVTNNQVAISVATATSSVLGVASFNATDFTVATGAVTVNEERIQDIIGAMVDSNTETNASVTYDDTTGKLNFSVATATSSVLGVASFNTASFTVTAGDVTIKSAGVSNAQLANSSFFIGTTSVSLGDASGTTSSLAVNITGKATAAGTADQVANSVTFAVTGGAVAGTTFNGSAAKTIDYSSVGAAPAAGSSSIVTVGTLTSGSIGVGFTAIPNTALANSSVTVGSTSISLGATSTSLTGLTQIDVDNITINGNEISSTDTNGNISLNPNGTGTVAVNSSRITGLADPTDAQDAATKAYVDARSAGLDPKASVRAATTANITLSNTQTVDGVALAVGNRVLVKDQTTASQNGIYIVASGAWTRSADMDEPAEMSSGVFFFVEEGIANADAGFVITTDGGTIVVGTDAVNFTQFSGAGQIVAGDGLTKSGNTLSVNVAANGGIEISADALQLKSTVAGNGLTYTNGVVDVAGTTDRISVSADAVDISANYVGQTSITTLGTITSGTWTATTIATTRGGTGLTTYAAGDLLYSNASNSLAKLAKPAATSLLTMDNAGAPTWVALSNTGITGLGTVTTGTWQATTIASAYGGTGITTYAKGDFLYASAANTLSKLTAGTNGQTLQLQDGVPYWGDLDGGTY